MIPAIHGSSYAVKSSRAHIRPWGEPHALSFSDICGSLPHLHDIGFSQKFLLPLDNSTTGFPDREGNYVATISPHSKYSPISVGAFIGWWIFRHANPYNQVQQSERLWKDPKELVVQIREIRTSSYNATQQSIYTPRDPWRKGGKMEEIVNPVYLTELTVISKNVANSLSPWFFFQIGFPRIVLRLLLCGSLKLHP